jgi:GNAT superfamily N-acetyltransferase
MVVVTRLAANDPLLGAVIHLWRANSATLGFFPEGAFRERAEHGQILVATSVADGLVGYLAYRRTRNRVAIIHLCVAEAQRGRSIARLLVERLCEEVRSCAGISLRCRRDFHANRLWSRFGFEAVNELRGL